MNSLLIFLFLMMLAAGLFVLVPLARARKIEYVDDRDVRGNKNVEVFKQSVNDLEEDLNNKLIDEVQFEKLKVELERSFIAEMSQEEKAKNTNVKDYKALPLSLMVVLFVLSFFFYRQVGSGQDIVLPELLDSMRMAETEEQQMQLLNELAVVLDDRFQRHIDNIQMGYSLGGVYLNLEQYLNAARIFQQLADSMEDSPNKAAVLGQLAQAQFLIADSTLSPEAEATIEQALSLNPNEQAVMSLLAINAFVDLDFESAMNYWRRQLLQMPAGGAEAATIRERIARMQSLLATQNGTDTETTGATAMASVSVRVELDESLRDQISEDMRVFVFARSEAMPMPLAAQTFSVDELPLTITLDDTLAMTPQFTLSSAESVFVGARISRTATAQSGDFQSISDTFVVAEQDEVVLLTISEIVP